MTREDIIQAIEQELFKDGGMRDQLTKDISNAIDARIGRWLLTGGFFLIIAAAAAWFTLKNQVDNNSQAIKQSLTQDQAALIIQRVDQLTKSVEEKNQTLQKLDDRLRAKGI